MTLTEFNERVHGRKESLCILDDLVLDVKDYMENHPGGKFLMSHTVGTDISKFFYGGYSLDGNLAFNQLKRHNHSNAARVQVDTMVIARLIPDEDRTDFTPLVTANISEAVEIAPQTKVLTFKFTNPITV